MTDMLGSTRVLGAVLLVAILPLIIPAAFAVGMPIDVWNMPLEEKLRTIARHPTAWRAANAFFLAALVLSVFGLAAISRELRGSPASLIADLAVLAYALAAVLWSIDLVFRMSGTVVIAEETARTGLVPTWAPALVTLGTALLLTYACLSNLAVLAVGAALLQTDVVAGWAGWVAVGVSGLALALLVVTRDNVPALNLLGPIAIGIAFLLPRS